MSTTASAERLLSDLTEPQREAAAHTDGPLLVLAAAGSGKTRVITRRAAHLARTVAKPSQILAITFTNKAAQEMRERIDALGVGPGMTVSTFHAWCARTLRIHHERAQVPKNFTIFDTEDSRKLLRSAVERCGLSVTNYPVARIQQPISRAKNALFTAEEFAERDAGWQDRVLAKIYACYEELLAGMGGLDFDDLLVRVARFLGKDEELRAELEQRYRYLLIDEYQDTNAAQYHIAHLLTRTHQNICATGDPDQSIYGWRGADIDNILSFERHYPDARVVFLEQNYRSTKRILAAADALIGGNTRRKQKALWTENAEGPAVRVIECRTHQGEAETVVQDILLRHAAGTRLNDVAVFYRVNSLSRTLEETLIRSGVAYQIARGVEFYNRKEIKDVLAYLRVLVNPADEVALLRIINTPPRGIGATSIDRLTALALGQGCTLVEVLTGGLLEELGRTAVKVQEFVTLLRELGAALELAPHAALDTVLSQSGLRAYYGGEEATAEGPRANLDELLSAALEFEQQQPAATVLDWLEHTALLGDLDSVHTDQGSVTLMTLHAAKGLEFPEVYIIGLEDGLLPLRREEDQEPDDMEEERRLCFVGMTRAQQRLTLTRALHRMLRGQTRRTVRSPFLDELPRAQLEWIGAEAERGSWALRRDDGELPEDMEQWEVGMLVRHPRYGLGKLTSLERGARRTHVRVLFENGKEQAWVLEFAELERVDFDEIG